MARLLPKQDISQIENRGERGVIEALLEKLEDHIEIFHSQKFYQRSKDTETLREGEIDVVILDKKRGFIVVEVKTGTIKQVQGDFYRIEDGKKITNPFDQASRGMHALNQKLIKTTGVDSCPHAYAVMLPDCKLGINETMQDPFSIFGAEEIHDHLEQNISRLFQALPKSSQMNKETYKILHNILMGDFQCIRSISQDLKHGNSEILRATEAQIKSMSVFDKHPRCAFSGGAGTGKTMLALHQSIKKANDGCKVLFTCFNKDIATLIKKDFEIPESLTVSHYHELGAEIMKKHKVTFLKDGERTDDEFWERKFPERLSEAIVLVKDNEKYDCIFIDEAQDFHTPSEKDVVGGVSAYKDWWLIIQLLLKNPDEGPIWIFYDERQNIFKGGGIPRSLFGPEKTFSLRTNMRNTQRIAAHVKELGEKIESNMAYDINTELPEGVDPSELEVITKDELLIELRRVVDEWRQGLNEGEDSKIVILSSSETHDDIGKSLKGIPLTSNVIAWREGKGVFLTTHGRFKGLESSLVIDIETPSNEKRYDRLKLRYVSHSRAKHKLVCIKFKGVWTTS